MSSPKHTKPPLPNNERERLLALRDFKILNTQPEADLDDITLLATEICGTPIGLISLLDENRIWFKSKKGFEGDEIARELAFCAHAVCQNELLIIEDATQDERFKHHPLVVDGPRILFYAGALLTTSDGYNLGTLCVIDRKPKKLSAGQVSALKALARQVVINFENHRFKIEADQHERFLSNIVSMLPDLVAYVDTDYRHRYVNRSYEVWFKIEANQALGREMKDVLGVAAFEKAKPFMLRALSGERQDFQVTLPYEVDGKTISKIVNAHYIPDRGANGSIKGFYAVVSDVTAWKTAENKAIEQSEKLQQALAASRASELSFRAFFDNSPMGVLLINLKMHIVAANGALGQFLGYSVDELKKMTILDVTHPDDIKRSIEAVQNAQTNGLISRFDKRYVHKSGRVVWGSVSSRLVQPEDGGEVYLYTVIEDITEVRKKEEDLKTAQLKLATSSKMASLGEMAGGVAHEINNPLAIIKGKTDILLSKLKRGSVDSNVLSSDLSVIATTADRIAKIVKGLRTFSRNASGDPFAKVKESQILDGTIVLCSARFEDGKVNLDVICQDDLEVECRSTEISQILMNLLSNSFDAVSSLEEKWVRVEVFSSGDRFKVKVTDSGRGLNPKVAANLMQPFFTTKEVGKGTGLGLSISRGLAEGHKGRLYYDPTQYNTCFILEIPLKQEIK